MLKKSASGVLASLRGSTYRTEYASPLRLLRPCWTAFLSILEGCSSAVSFDADHRSFRVPKGFFRSLLDPGRLELRLDAQRRLVQHRRGGAGKGGVLLVVERIDTKLHQAGREEVQTFFQRLDGDALGAGIVDIERNPAGVFGVRARIERRHVHAERQGLQVGGQRLPDLLLELFVAGKIHPPL